LEAFAGCFDKIIGVEYEDCYFTIHQLPGDDLRQWFNQSLDNTSPSAPRRNLKVIQTALNGDVIAAIDVHDAFLRELTVSDFVGSEHSGGSISFVVVPDAITNSSGGSSGIGAQAKTFLKSSFRMEITNVNGNRVGSIDGIRAFWSKDALNFGGGGGGRRHFQPGQASFDDLEVAVGTSGGSTAADLDDWVAEMATSTNVERNGTLHILESSLQQDLGRIDFVHLVPVYFPAFFTGANQRTIILHVGGFEFH
jgi:hypothetical protein